MISVIICSVNQVLLKEVQANIARTVGVAFEVIVIDNSGHRYGICQAYNEGGKKARYPVLCFMHEDIFLETMDWGQLVCAHLADPRVGLLGVAGGDAKSLVPSSWSVPVRSNEINLMQHYKSSRLRPERIFVTNPAYQSVRKKVVALDGLWLCTRREIFEEFQFDAKTFTGFHGYDIDFSLQVAQRYELFVIFDVLIHHFSEGTADRKWIDSAILLSHKWKNNLPVSVYQSPHPDYGLHHWQSLRVFMERLFQLKYPVTRVLRYLFAYSFGRFFSMRRFLSVTKFVILQSIAGNRKLS